MISGRRGAEREAGEGGKGGVDRWKDGWTRMVDGMVDRGWLGWLMEG